MCFHMMKYLLGMHAAVVERWNAEPELQPYVNRWLYLNEEDPLIPYLDEKFLPWALNMPVAEVRQRCMNLDTMGNNFDAEVYVNFLSYHRDNRTELVESILI